MQYTDLLIEADIQGLIVKEKQLNAYDGRIKGNRIAIRMDMPTTQKACVLAEELGHNQTGYGNILQQASISDIKQEQRARLWAYNKMIGLQGIVRAYKHGCTSLYEMAEYLEVTEEFLHEALTAYRHRYGCFAQIDNYVVYFEPNLGGVGNVVAYL